MDAYVKRDSILDKNIQKAYSLMLGQYTELLKSKLKTTTDWMTVSTDFDLLGHIKTIRSVIFKFEDQRSIPKPLAPSGTTDEVEKMILKKRLMHTSREILFSTRISKSHILLCSDSALSY